VAKRSWRALALRLLAPCFFVLLALLLDAAVRADVNRTSSHERIKTPGRHEIRSIKQCSGDVFVSESCYDFVYSPADSAPVQVRCHPHAFNVRCY
jgi:hypothetical protein